MTEPARRHAHLEVLGLSAGAPPSEVARACRELRDLYAEDSLATYSLLAPEERTALLRRVEEAHAELGGRPAEPAPTETATPPDSPSAPTVDPAQSPGAFLRACREAKGVTLQEVAGETKISSRHLENIENENFRQLPVRVYLRGFLIAYARALRLDGPQQLADRYLTRVEAEHAQVA